MTTVMNKLPLFGVLLALAALAFAPAVRPQDCPSAEEAPGPLPVIPAGPRAARVARITVAAFYAGGPARLRGDAAWLGALAARFATRGVRVVAVSPDGSAADLSPGAGVELFEDPACVLEAACLEGGATSRRYVVAIGAGREVLFRGAPGCGLEDMLVRELGGDADRDYEARAQSWRHKLYDTFDEAPGAEAVALLAPLARRSPRDGLLNGLLYLAYATKSNERDAAAALLLRATREMARAPRALAIFADLAMRGDPLREEVWRMLRPALERACERAPTDPFVQRALLRARVAARDDRAAGRLAMQRRALMTATAQGCLDFATMLARAETPMIYRDIAEHALRRAAALQAEPRLLAAARYVVTLRCAEDAAGAQRLLRAYCAERGDYYRRNSDAWRFLTQVGTMGRYDWFAVGLVEGLLRGPEALDYFELDTAALAMFAVGRAGEAVDLQRAALREGGEQEAAYRDRLRRYEAFAAPGPR